MSPKLAGVIYKSQGEYMEVKKSAVSINLADMISNTVLIPISS